MNPFNRRDFLKFTGAASALSLAGCATTGNGPKARVVVIGGGFGGATAAKYIRMWDPGIEVTMVERLRQFTSCPTSNLVIGGARRIDEIQRSYNGLKKHGVKVVEAEATGVDTAKRVVTLAGGKALPYDRLVLSPGIDFMFDQIAGYEAAMDAGAVLHAWQAGPQTVELRTKLELMRNGGVFVLSIPTGPYRCPPGPYERVCMVANYLKQAKPRSKVLVLDANPGIVSKGKLFQEAWTSLYKGLIEYRPNSKAIGIDARTRTVKLEVEDVRGDVLNVIPPQKAGGIAFKAGVVNANNRWCGVNWLTTESTSAPNVHVIGDSSQGAAGMPKSGHMANSQAKVCAAAVVALLNGEAPNPAPVVNNTCYSFVSPDEVVHVASVHQWNAEQKTILPVKGAGGLTPTRNRLEADYAWSWAQNIWSDMLA